MTKRTRLIILAVCAILFLIITPYIILYSLGYRVDFKNLKIVATGGIYVKAMPSGADIIIDNNLSDTTSFFSDSVFVQNLLPETHLVQIQKVGYHDYQKNVEVKEKSVTKLEHVQLFKKNILFNVVTDLTKSPFAPKVTADPYVIKNNNLYYAEPKTNIVSPAPTKIITPVIINIVTYKISNNSIIWLGQDGFLYSSNLDGTNTKKLFATGLKIDKKNTANIEISPSGQKIIYFNDQQVFLSSLTSGNPDLPMLSTGNLLNTFNEKIKDAYWLNDDYVVLGLENKIVISETDIRGTINTVQLPNILMLINGERIAISNPKISFNQQEKKLYILSGNTLLVSEKLLP